MELCPEYMIRTTGVARWNMYICIYKIYVVLAKTERGDFVAKTEI